MAEHVPEIQFSGTRYHPKNGWNASWTRLFFILCTNFCHICWFFSLSEQLWCAPLWKIIKYGKNLATNDEKPSSTCLKPISPWHYGLRVPATRVLGTHLFTIVCVFFQFNKLHHTEKFVCNIQSLLLCIWFIYIFNTTIWNTSLKLEKKCNFKSTKTHFLLFQKWQKINFCTRKKFKTTKNALLGLFSGAKFDFFAIFENANNVFLYFWNCTFFLILEHGFIFLFNNLGTR